MAKNEGIMINYADEQVAERIEKALEEIRKSPEMKGKNVKPAGNITCSWKQSNSWKITKYPVSAATVGVTGKFYTKETQTGGGGISIPGFTFSGYSSTTKTYVSNNMTIQKQYRVY